MYGLWDGGRGARSGDAGVGALCRYCTGLRPHPSSHTLSHRLYVSSYHLTISSQACISSIKGSTSRAFAVSFLISFFCYELDIYLFTSPNSPVHSALARLVALLASVTREAKMVFSALEQAANRLAATVLLPDAASIPPIPPAFNPGPGRRAPGQLGPRQGPPAPLARASTCQRR